MVVTLFEKPEKPIIVQGFAGAGLVGSIVTEYLINAPEVRTIGHIFFEKMAPIVVVHEGKLLHPAGIYYNPKYNLVIIHTLVPLQGLEWDFANEVMELYAAINAWELLSIEGVASKDDGNDVYSYANNDESRKQLIEKNIQPISEGILMGVSAAITLKAKLNELKMINLFATTHSLMPDSVAAAEVIKTLDKLFGFNIDPEPLADMAKDFEDKIKTIMSQSAQAKDKGTMNYVG